VDCELDEPTQFAIKSVTIYHYDAAGNPIHTDGRDDGGEYNGHTELQYDSKGRLSGSIDIDESDDTVDTIIYTYAASDSENFSTGEPTAVQKIIFGHSMEYAPLSITTQLYSISSSTKIDYKNTGNADGYLVSSTATVGGVNGRTTTYTYDCVDK
jgi:hypothetical protein